MDRLEFVKKLASAAEIPYSEGEIFLEIFLRKVCSQKNPGETFGYPDLGIMKFERDDKGSTEFFINPSGETEDIHFLLPREKEFINYPKYNLSIGKPVFPLSRRNENINIVLHPHENLNSLESRADKIAALLVMSEPEIAEDEIIAETPQSEGDVTIKELLEDNMFEDIAENSLDVTNGDIMDDDDLAIDENKTLDEIFGLKEETGIAEEPYMQEDDLNEITFEEIAANPFSEPGEETEDEMGSGELAPEIPEAVKNIPVFDGLKSVIDNILNTDEELPQSTEGISLSTDIVKDHITLEESTEEISGEDLDMIEAPLLQTFEDEVQQESSVQEETGLPEQINEQIPRESDLTMGSNLYEEKTEEISEPLIDEVSDEIHEKSGVFPVYEEPSLPDHENLVEDTAGETSEQSLDEIPEEILEEYKEFSVDEFLDNEINESPAEEEISGESEIPAETGLSAEPFPVQETEEKNFSLDEMIGEDQEKNGTDVSSEQDFKPVSPEEEEDFFIQLQAPAEETSEVQAGESTFGELAEQFKPDEEAPSPVKEEEHLGEENTFEKILSSAPGEEDKIQDESAKDDNPVIDSSYQRVKSLTREFYHLTNLETSDTTLSWGFGDSEKIEDTIKKITRAFDEPEPAVGDGKDGFQVVKSRKATYEWTPEKIPDIVPVSDEETTEEIVLKFDDDIFMSEKPVTETVKVSPREEKKSRAFIIIVIILIIILLALVGYYKLTSDSAAVEINMKKEPVVIQRDDKVPVMITEKIEPPAQQQNTFSENNADDQTVKPQNTEPVKVADGIYQLNNQYYIQVSSWKTKSKAVGERDRFARKGYKSMLMESQLNSDLYYRVLVGEFKTEGEASDFYKSNTD